MTYVARNIPEAAGVSGVEKSSDQRSQAVTLSRVSGKNIFIAGVGAGFLILCTAGFFILLAVMIKGQ